MQIKDHTEAQYWCAYSTDLTVFHIGKLEVGQVLSTGQPNLESFATEAELRTRIDELKGEGWYDEHMSQE